MGRKDPAYSAVPVVNTSVRLFMVAALLSEENVTRFDEFARAHTADDTTAPLMDSWQPESVPSEKAEGKVTDRSKLVLKEVMALSWMVYCEMVRVVLGLTPEEATAKLTCALRVVIITHRQRLGLSSLVSFI